MAEIKLDTALSHLTKMADAGEEFVRVVDEATIILQGVDEKSLVVFRKDIEFVKVEQRLNKIQSCLEKMV